ncbi:MAG: DUF4382 domain-containing protein [Dehalococcoidia bacterium]|nr:DUF4382 domain-containing protein [Dehalococcoidia bacterium]
MKTRIALLLALVLGTLQLAACATPVNETTSPDVQTQGAAATTTQNAEPNFLLVVSDEANDIADFTSLWVTITSIGFVQGDNEGIIEVPLDPTATVNLVEFQGADAVDLWEGYIPDGDYTGVFLYVDTTVTGELTDGGDPIEVKLPSNKLHLTIPLTVGDEAEGDMTEFVFDITVHRAGNSGQYILSPQLSESGEGKEYRLLEKTQNRLKTGKPEWAGNPEDAGKPEKAGKPEEAGTGAQAAPPEDAGKPTDAGKPADGGKREEAGIPDMADKPGTDSDSPGGGQS